MTAPPIDQEYAGVDEYFASTGDDELDRHLEDSGIADKLRDAEPKGQGDPMARIAPIPDGGPLLEEPDWKKVFKAIDKTLLSQERLARNRNEEEIHLKRIVRGVGHSYLEKNQDRSVYKASLPDFVDDRAQPVPNKVADLKKKVIAQMTADDFLPDPKADGQSDRDRGACDVGKKFLRQDAGASGTNDKQMIRESLGINMTGKSAFQWGWMDPTGGGWKPKQVRAHPEAEDASRPMYGPKKVMGKAGVAEPLMGEDGRPLMIEKTSNAVLRYVGEDEQGNETFVDDPAAAARQWRPRIRRTTLYPNQVRTVPVTATVPEAEQIIVLMGEPLAIARKRFPILDELPKEKLAKLCTWRPSKWWKLIIPEAFRSKMREFDDDPKNPTPDTMLFWYHSFHVVSGDYMDGGEVAVSGMDGGFGLKRETLRVDVKLDDGRTAPVLMRPPIAQFICLQDTETGDPMGYGFVKDFEGGNEAYAQIWIGMLDLIDQNLNRNVMIPATSPITGAEWRRRDRTPLEILSADDEPKYEQPLEAPDILATMLDRVELVMNNEAQTNETSNGLDSKYSISGVAKDIAIRQARTGLANYWQNTVNGLSQWWSVKLDLARAHFTVPQQVMYSGVETAYKQPWWVGSDLFGIATDVPLQAGSGTMMNPMEKLNLLGLMVTQKFMEPEQAAEIARSTMTDDLGIAPSIHEQHADRMLGAWADGPPPEFAQILQANQQATEQYQTAIQQRVAVLVPELLAQGMDEATATQQAQATVQQQIAQPQLQELPTPFDPRPNDEDPAVAKIQYSRGNRMASTVEYSDHPLEWRQVFDQWLTTVRQRAGIPTVAEQQQAEQQSAMNDRYAQFIQLIDKKVNALVEQEIAKVVAGGLGDGENAAAAETENAAADREHSSNESQLDREHKSAEADKDRKAKAEQHARDVMSKEAIAARREQSPAQTASRQPAGRR